MRTHHKRDSIPIDPDNKIALRVCGNYQQFADRSSKLTSRLLKQGVDFTRLQNTFRKFLQQNPIVLCKTVPSEPQKHACSMCSLPTVCFFFYVPSHLYPLNVTPHTHTHVHTTHVRVLSCCTEFLFTSCLLVECFDVCHPCHTHCLMPCTSLQCLFVLYSLRLVGLLCTSHASQCLFYTLHLSAHTMLHVRSVLDVLFNHVAHTSLHTSHLHTQHTWSVCCQSVVDHVPCYLLFAA